MSYRDFRTVILVVALGILLGVSDAAAADEAAVGHAERVWKSVTADGPAAMRYLSDRSQLYRQDTLRSYSDARLEARLRDDTRITMGENAVVTIDDFLYAPGTTGGRLSLRVLDGAMLFVGGRTEAGRGGDVEITTSFATVGVRGTTVWAGPLDDAFAVFVVAGEVTVSNAGRSVTLTSGEGTTIASLASPPQPAVVWRQPKIDRALAAVAFVP